MRIPQILALTATAVLALALASCSTTTAPAPAGSTPAGDSATDTTSYPIEIDHVYGTTTISEEPVNIATVGWGNQEVPLALGVVPVGMGKITWGDDDGDGVMPWVKEKLDELGADIPVLFDQTDGIPFEEVADTNPDVILAAYSGISKEEYDTLTKIAPVIAFPDVPWGTTWEQMVEMNSKAMGREADGQALIADLKAQIQTAFDAVPELDGKKVSFAWTDPSDLSQIDLYSSHDTRPGFLESLGLPTPDAVAHASAESDSFTFSLSAENADRLDDVDIFTTYGDDTTVATLQADPLLSQIPAIAEGRIAVLPNGTPLAASANPSPLSIPWGLERYFALFTTALNNATSQTAG